MPNLTWYDVKFDVLDAKFDVPDVKLDVPDVKFDVFRTFRNNKTPFRVSTLKGVCY